MEEKIFYFQKEEDGTDKALQLALDTAKGFEIKSVVLASTSGNTATKAAKMFKGSGVNLFIVGHQYGMREPGKTRFTKENIEMVEKLGFKVHFGTDLLTATVGALREKFGSGPFGIVADTLRMFCQGMKVATEVAIMACDAGLVSSEEDVVAVAGTGKGANTVVILQPANTYRIFQTRIKRIIAKEI